MFPLLVVILLAVCVLLVFDASGFGVLLGQQVGPCGRRLEIVEVEPRLGGAAVLGQEFGGSPGGAFDLHQHR